MRRFLWSLVSILLLAIAGSPVMATVQQPLSDFELAERAHAIVLGRATAQQTVWLGRDLVTLVTVAVAESLKGSPGATLTVALPGGIDRQRKIPIEVLYVGAPRIAHGEEVLLFLERSQRHAKELLDIVDEELASVDRTKHADLFAAALSCA